MLIITLNTIPDRKYEIIGLVKGCTVQSKHIGKDIAAGLKTIIGGELTSYTEMMNEARALATKRMVEEAEALGADAVLGMQYMSATITTGAAEVVAYGTAIKFLSDQT